MLTKLVKSLNLEFPGITYRHVRFYNKLNHQLRLITPATFVSNWFNYLDKVPNIGASYQDNIDLTNVYNLALLCTYIERYGVPKGKWINKALEVVINGTEFILPEGNLTFYKILKDKVTPGACVVKQKIVRPADSFFYQSLDRNRIMNAAMEAGHLHFNKKSEFINKLLLQGLIIRITNPEVKNLTGTYNFASEDIKEAIGKFKENSFIKSRVASRTNILTPLIHKITNKL